MAGKLLSAADFFQKYNVQQEDFEKTGLAWTDLEAIYEDHVENIPNLQPIANYIVESLRQLKEVHSLRVRIKDSEHLIEKIIRKKIDNKTFKIDVDNYKSRITDLIGVRALHLFKEDWGEIHEYVKRTWKLKEKPTANIREGDSADYVNGFKERNCKINKHQFGYRSVHYLIKSQPSKEIFIAELQVRTIFEEAWSEIDHKIRYPYETNNIILAQVSAIHNRLAGSADEIGSFIKILKKELEDRDAVYHEAKVEQEKLLSDLNEKVQELEITEKQKKDLETRIKSLSQRAIILPDLNLFAQAVANIKMPVFDPSLIAALTQIQKNNIRPIKRISLERGDKAIRVPATHTQTDETPKRIETQKPAAKLVKRVTNGKKATVRKPK